MAYIIRWWQFGGKDGWTPDSTITFGCDANKRSMHEEELSEICVGAFMASWNSNCDVTFSNAFPWEVLLSLRLEG